jgi:hypothetical protein
MKHLLKIKVHKGAIHELEKKFFLPFDTIEIVTGVRDVRKDKLIRKKGYKTINIL